MARASYRTLVSLDQFAKVLSLSPVHFNGAVAGDFWPDKGSCEDIFTQYPWQTPEDFVSREEIAGAIYNAEHDIERILGYSIAPKFISAESASYPRPFTPAGIGFSGGDLRGAGKSIKTRLGKIIATGRRATAVLSALNAIVFSDVDGDGWKETASISFADTTTALNEIRVYFAGKSADPAWEIRPPRSIARTSGVVTITLDSWLFINPLLWEKHPISANRPDPIDISTVANFVTTIDVYREYIDTTAYASEFSWETSGTCGCDDGTCAACSATTQTGCLTIREPNRGYVVPRAATYDSGWLYSAFTACREPESVKLWYYAGAVSEEYQAGYTYNPVSDYFATTVMWLAVARLQKPICSCDHVKRVVSELQRDMSQITKSSTFVLNLATDLFTNPFGTKVGEYRAWQRLARLTDDYVVIGGTL